MVTSMVMRPARAKTPPETISAAEFKARCLELMDTVAATGASIVVTKRGRPVARLSPARARRGPGLGFMKDRIRILGDIVSPIDAAWDADG
jgi:prevent-host-death family protein